MNGILGLLCWLPTVFGGIRTLTDDELDFPLFDLAKIFRDEEEVSAFSYRFTLSSLPPILFLW